MIARSFAFTTLLLVCAGNARAETPEMPTSEPEPHSYEWLDAEPRIIPLKNADSKYVSDALQGVFRNCEIRPLERGLLFRGTDTAYERAQKLIARLDSPSEGDGDRAIEVSMLPVRNRRAEDLLRQLMPVVDRRGTQIAADRDRGTIIVRGPRTFIDQVQKLVTALDTPTPTVSLDFSFFGATPNKTTEGLPIPTDLNDVVKELQRFGNIRLIGQLATVATENEKFKLEGNVADLYIVSIEGILESAAPDGSVRIRLNAKIVSDKREVVTASQPGPPSRRPAFLLETTVIVKRGTYAALGVAPCGYNDGQSGILVLHVQP